MSNSRFIQGFCDVCSFYGEVFVIKDRGSAGVCSCKGCLGEEVWNKEKIKTMKPRATELEYLQWFYSRADFGPAEGDVRDYLKQKFIDETGKNIPEGYNYWSDGETKTDN